MDETIRLSNLEHFPATPFFQLLIRLFQVAQDNCQAVVEYLSSGRQEENRYHHLLET